MKNVVIKSSFLLMVLIQNLVQVKKDIKRAMNLPKVD